MRKILFSFLSVFSRAQKQKIDQRETNTAVQECDKKTWFKEWFSYKRYGEGKREGAEIPSAMME